MDIKPLLASPVVAGFPSTNFERGIPEAAIWNNAEFGQVLDEVERRPSHVVYSLVPSEIVSNYHQGRERDKTYGCRTIAEGIDYISMYGSPI